MREYTVQGENLTIVGSCTLVHINPPSARSIKIIRAWCSQSGTTTSAQIRIAAGFKVTAFPTLVSTTPEKTKPSDPVSYITGGTAGAAGTAGVNAAAEGAGAFTVKYPDAFNNLVGWIWTPNLGGGEAYELSGADSTAFAIKMLNTPATLTGWTFGVTYAEQG